MSTTKHTQKEIELIKIVSEAIDELNNIGCEDIANELTKKLEKVLEIGRAHV